MKRSKYSFHDFSAKHTPSATLRFLAKRRHLIEHKLIFAKLFLALNHTCSISNIVKIKIIYLFVVFTTEYSSADIASLIIIYI